MISPHAFHSDMDQLLISVHMDIFLWICHSHARLTHSESPFPIQIQTRVIQESRLCCRFGLSFSLSSRVIEWSSTTSHDWWALGKGSVQFRGFVAETARELSLMEGQTAFFGRGGCGGGDGNLQPISDSRALSMQDDDADAEIGVVLIHSTWTSSQHEATRLFRCPRQVPPYYLYIILVN